MSEQRICYYIPIDGYVEGRGFRVSIVKEGESGHYPTGEWPNDGAKVMPYFWGHDYEKACDIARRQNKALGLTEEDVMAIVGSSMGAQIRGEATERKRAFAEAMLDAMGKNERRPHAPAFATGQRVGHRGEEQVGRVQGVTWDAGTREFRYVVKWDVGPTTPHLESELRASEIPTHYP